jgi:hypothetical protein
MKTNEVTCRHVAIMMASALPIEGEDFRNRVEANLEAIKSLPVEQKTALKMAYIFSRKVPRQEREDLFQDIAIKLFEANTSEQRLAYAIARCDWRDWWKKYKIRQHYSIDSVTEDEDGNPATLGELIVGESEFELKMDGKLEAQKIWHKLPDKIKPIVQNRLLGQALTHQERNTLNYWVRTQGYSLLLQN